METETLLPTQAAAGALEALHAMLDEYFPDLRCAVDIGLSVAASLLLKDNVNPVAVILVGSPGKSKTTVASMFADHPQCYRSDNFTPASFVSQAANRRQGDLAKVDLLPRIKHKLLVTPELASIFRGKDDELTKRFSTMTRVLDGQGLLTDSGTQGQRGYKGDYLFAWLGCTTPLDAKVWSLMAQLGSRLFFYSMDAHPPATDEDLLNDDEGASYRERVERCRVQVGRVIEEMFSECGGPRGVEWNKNADPKPVRNWLARLARLVAAARSVPPAESDGGPGSQEDPRRAYAVLGNLARGHALVNGRRQLTDADLPPVARVAVSSLPHRLARVFLGLVGNGGEPLTIAEAQAALGVRDAETARRAMHDLAT